jgi:predicted RNase H-like HicB family nuclease
VGLLYAIVIEKTRGGFGAYVPDLPGCAAPAPTEGEVIAAIRKGIEIYIQELMARGESVPEPITKCTEVEVRV